jgi:hypothetical protein
LIAVVPGRPQRLPPDELYEKLEPFKRRVADDIRSEDDS